MISKLVDAAMSMKLNEYQHPRSFFDFILRFQNLNLVFSETVGLPETKFHVKPYGSLGMKIYINELGHMTKMPIYGKTF